MWTVANSGYMVSRTRDCLLKQKGHTEKDREGWTSPEQGSDPAEAVQASHPEMETLGLKWDSALHGPTGAGIPPDQFRCAQGVTCM